jgi:hypothetical protein
MICLENESKKNKLQIEIVFSFWLTVVSMCLGRPRVQSPAPPKKIFFFKKVS